MTTKQDAFEAAMKKAGWSDTQLTKALNHPYEKDGNYIYPAAQNAFEGWKAAKSALAEQDDEAVARVLTLSNLGFSTRGSIEWIGNKYALPPNALLYTRPAPKTYTEHEDRAAACLTCPNNRDVVCAYCEGSGLAKVETGELLPCPQGCDIPEHANVLSVIDKQLYGRYVHTVVSDAKYPPGTKLYPVEQKQHPESDIDVAIGVVEWDKLNLFETAEAVKQIVMRFAGSQVTMEVKRLSDDEIIAINDAMLGCAVMTPITFANALMEKMTGGKKCPTGDGEDQ